MIEVGEIITNNKGYTCEVIEYVNFKNVVISFGNPSITYNVKGCHLRSGCFKSPLEKSVAKVGYIGEGVYRPKENGIFVKEYTLWRDMLHRCYNNNLKSFKDYGGRGVTVCEEWHNFQNFAAWCNNQKYFSARGYDLDKDILGSGKLYSESCCCFVPRRINNLIKKCKLKVDNPSSEKLGVYFDISKNKYASCCWDGKGKYKFLGYGSEEECESRYRKFKRDVIRETAEENRFKIDEYVYERLINISQNE